MDKKLGRLHASLDDKIKRANEKEQERKRLFSFEKSLKVQWRHRPDNSEKVKNLEFQQEGAFARNRWAQKAEEALYSQLNTVRGIIDGYRQGLSNFTERVRTDVTDVLGGFLFELFWEV